MVIEEVEELGTGDVLACFGDLRAAREAADRDIFLLAAHYADRHHVDSRRGHLSQLPGTEQPVRLAGIGTPLVLEFAIAELAVELHTSTWAARRLIGDALETRHRLPRIWAAVRADAIPAWRARKIAQATRELSPEQAGYVDCELADVVGDQISYGRFTTLLEAAVIAADPDAAAARERAAAEQRFAKVGQSNEHGQKTLYVKTSAAEMTRIDATIAYLAQALRTLGDPEDEDGRRTKAVLLLANPTQAVALLQTLATHQQQPTPAGTTSPDATPGSNPSPGDAGARDDGAGNDGIGGSGRGPRRRPVFAPIDDALPEPDDHPDPPPPPDPLNDDPLDGHDRGDRTGKHGGHGKLGGRERPDGPETDPNRRRAPATEPGAEDPAVDLGRFFTPFHPTDTPPCGCRGGTWRPDSADLLPAVKLYLHMHESTVRDDSNGVARWEDEGPISTHYVRDLLGPHCRFTITGVIDLANQAPVDGYEIPARHREALHLRTPSDVFPFAPNTRRGKQVDHTRPYRHKQKSGHRPGQTSIDNLGPMTAFHHRVKTHAHGWQHAQPFPGIYLWKAPHGSIFLVNHTGTRQLRGPRTSARYQQARTDHRTDHRAAERARGDLGDHTRASSPAEHHLQLLVLGA